METKLRLEKRNKLKMNWDIDWEIQMNEDASEELNRDSIWVG